MNTADPTLYQTNRYGNFTYTFTVAPGMYNVILKFAEFYWTSPGQRLFNVSINGTQVLSNFDIIAAAGAPLTAVDENLPGNGDGKFDHHSIQHGIDRLAEGGRHRDQGGIAGEHSD